MEIFSYYPKFGPILGPKLKNGHISGTTGPISKIFEILDFLPNAVVRQKFGLKNPTYMDRPPVYL